MQEINKYRTHNCGSLSKNDIDKKVSLSGWIDDIRIKKFAIFLDLRDSYGLTQIIVKKEDENNFNILKSLKNESVIKINGLVVARKTENPKIKTGAIEVICQTIDVLSCAKDLPFVINNENNFTALEDLRLEYRYLDLRRKKMFNQLKFKHKVISSIRNFLNSQEFLEIDTPCLTKSTPEGARDFLVPSRFKKNSFYALPQSPQLYKQLLMVSAIDKYYQIAKCFRDEDFRADRQPEFQQLDLEMAFSDQKNVMNLVEKLLANLKQDLNLSKINLPIQQISYHEAINSYGSDKPDLRCSCKIVSFSQKLRGFWVKDSFDDQTKKEILRIVQQHSSTNFLVYSYSKHQIIFNSNSKCVLDETQLNAIKASKLNDANLCYLTYEDSSVGAITLGAIRTYYCQDEKKQKNHQDFLANIDEYKFVWIVDWPMFEIADNKISSVHHPFTSPLEPQKILAIKAQEHEKLLSLNSAAYDLVLNGFEIAGGSVRIFDRNIQEHIFNILNLGKDVVLQRFGFFLKAFDYGIPPHAGIAFGLDRFIMILTNCFSIRDTIAFPKNNSGVDLLTNAPSTIDSEQLKELGLKEIERIEEKNEK